MLRNAVSLDVRPMDVGRQMVVICLGFGYYGWQATATVVQYCAREVGPLFGEFCH